MDETTMVRLNCGANSTESASVVGWTIGQIKREFGGALNIPTNARAHVISTGYGEDKSDNYHVKAGDHVSFSKAAGTKA